MAEQFRICGMCGKNCLGSMFKSVAFKAVVFIQLALWLIPLTSRKQSSVYVAATVDLYTKEVAASGGALNNLQYPSVLGGSTVLETLYSTYNATGIMAIGVALLAAGGLFALRALPDPKTLNTRLEGLTNLIRYKQSLLPELPPIPISKGHIKLPKFHKFRNSPYNNRHYQDSGGGEDGDPRGIISFGPPVLPPITNTNYNGLYQAVNPFVRLIGNKYVPPTSYLQPPTSTIVPSVGYTNFDPLSIFDPATTTRSAPPTRATNSKTKNSGTGIGSDVNLGLSPGPPYYRDFELEDYLKLHLKGKDNNDIKTSKKKLTPYGGQVYKNIRVLTAKTRQAIKQARNKFKGVAETIPKRLNNGFRKTFGRRQYIILEDDLGDDYYYDSTGEITGATSKDVKYNDDSAGRVYDYYDEKMLNKYLNEPYYVTENVVVFPKSKPKAPNSPVKRII